MQSLLQTFAGGEDSGEEGGKHDGYGARGNGYERHSKLDEFRREQRERGVREQFEKAVEGQKAEERRITALGSIIDRDRSVSVPVFVCEKGWASSRVGVVDVRESERNEVDNSVVLPWHWTL